MLNNKDVGIMTLLCVYELSLGGEDQGSSFAIGKVPTKGLVVLLLNFSCLELCI